MQENSRCRLCGERDETINHIRECSKLAQREYKTRYDQVGKMIHWKLCKNWKFDYTNKLYMNKPEFVLENEVHKIHWDFEIQSDHLISTRRPNLVIVKKKKKEENLPNSGLCCPSWLQGRTERK